MQSNAYQSYTFLSLFFSNFSNFCNFDHLSPLYKPGQEKLQVSGKSYTRIGKYDTYIPLRKVTGAKGVTFLALALQATLGRKVTEVTVDTVDKGVTFLPGRCTHDVR